jgi:hypothetical protein
VAPEICANKAHYEYLVIGKHSRDVPSGATEEWAHYCELDDPEGEDPLTQRYSSGLRALKQILIATNHKFAGADVIDMDEVMDDFNIKSPKEQLIVGAKLITKAGRDGRENNEITIYTTPESMEPGLTTTTKEAKKAPAARKAAVTPRVRTRARVETDYDDDEIE